MSFASSEVGWSRELVPATAEAETEARRRFEIGVQAARDERWEAARQEFIAALKIFPKAVIYLNLAAAELRSGRLLQAAQAYRSFLALPASFEYPARGQERLTAEQLLKSLDAQIPSLQIIRSANLEAVTFVLDGVTLTETELAKPLAANPGSHQLVGKMGDDIVLTKQIVLLEAQHVQVHISESMLTPVVVRTSLAPPPQRRLWPWAVAGSVVTAIAAAVIMVSRSDDTYSGNIPPGRVGVP